MLEWLLFNYFVDTEEDIARFEVVRESVLLHLQRQDIALAGDLVKPLAQFFQGGSHEQHEVTLVNVLVLLSQQLLVHISQKFD